MARRSDRFEVVCHTSLFSDLLNYLLRKRNPLSNVRSHDLCEALGILFLLAASTAFLSQRANPAANDGRGSLRVCFSAGQLDAAFKFAVVGDKRATANTVTVLGFITGVKCFFSGVRSTRAT